MKKIQTQSLSSPDPDSTVRKKNAKQTKTIELNYSVLVLLNILLSRGHQGETITGLWNFLNAHGVSIPTMDIF